jgi:hypothetical protein
MPLARRHIMIFKGKSRFGVKMIIRNDKDREEVIGKINDIDLKKPWKVDCSPFKPKRSVAMNSLLYAWYSAIAKHTGEGVAYTRGYLKFEYGVPILLARGEAEFDDLINSIVDKMQYEQIVALFGTETIAISSVMKVPEMADYLQHIEHYCQERHIPLLRGDEYDFAFGIK